MPLSGHAILVAAMSPMAMAEPSVFHEAPYWLHAFPLREPSALMSRLMVLPAPRGMVAPVKPPLTPVTCQEPTGPGAGAGESDARSKRCVRVAPATSMPFLPMVPVIVSDTVYGPVAGRPTSGG